MSCLTIRREFRLKKFGVNTHALGQIHTIRGEFKTHLGAKIISSLTGSFEFKNKVGF